MTDIKDFEKKIQKLEQRLSRLESALATDSEETEFMDALYQKAQELVIQHHKASPIFLQRKLLIDYQRAEKLLDKLRANGILEPEFKAES